MNLTPYIQENPEATLVDVRAHTETATRLMSTDMIVSYLDHFRLIQHFKNSNKSAEMATMLAISSSAEFNFIVGITVGDTHLESIGDKNLKRLDDIIKDVDVVADISTKTIDGNELTLAQRLTAFKQAVINYCNYTAYPFSETTQQEFDIAKRPQPTFTEVTYVGVGHINTHLVRADSKNTQAIELCFNVTDGTTGVNFEIKTMACTDLSSDATKNDISNYQHVAAKWLTRMGDTISMIDHLEKNFAVKSVVKIFVKPSKPCAFSCVAR